MEISRSKAKIITATSTTTSTTTTTCSTSTNKPIVKKSVQFCEIVSIRSTTHINDMSDEEVARAWFGRRDMMSIKRALATEVKCMVAGQTSGPDTTGRGLEFRTKEGSSKRRANKLNSIHAVLDEQDLQHMRDINEPEGLRTVYMSHSRRCLAAAQKLGHADEIESRMINKSEEKESQEDDESQAKKNVFLRLFTKKRAVMEELKQLTIEN
jgi:hypothetical protein